MTAEATHREASPVFAILAIMAICEAHRTNNSNNQLSTIKSDTQWRRRSQSRKVSLSSF